MNGMYLEKLKIEKLFGSEDIEIEFNRELNILVGKNGCGKTTVLEIVYSILNLNLKKINEYPFEKIELRTNKWINARIFEETFSPRRISFK